MPGELFHWMKKISDTILVALIVTGIIIGLHQSIMVGFYKSYWIFMVSFALRLAAKEVDSICLKCNRVRYNFYLLELKIERKN